jgi:hypothetical protein
VRAYAKRPYAAVAEDSVQQGPTVASIFQPIRVYQLRVMVERILSQALLKAFVIHVASADQMGSNALLMAPR